MSEILFQGSSALLLDGKGRVTVPARHRDDLAALCGSELTLTKHPSGCLALFPRPVWVDFRSRLLQMPLSAERWRRVYIGSAVNVEVDSGSRIPVSPELRKFAGLEKEVLLVGMGRRLELWDAARYEVDEGETLASEPPQAIQDFVI